jgi:prephenate dehydratase
MPKPKNPSRIAFQGVPGAYSHLACKAARPEFEPLPCPSFEEAFEAVRSGRAELGMIPIENSLAGRVAEIHHLIPSAGLHIVGEHFQRVEHCLLAPKGASLATLKRAHSHPMALGQVLKVIKELNLQPVIEADTAGGGNGAPARLLYEIVVAPGRTGQNVTPD